MEIRRKEGRERVVFAAGHDFFADFLGGDADEFHSVGGLAAAGVERFGFGEFVGFVVGFQSAVLTMERAFGGVFVAEHEVVHLDLCGFAHKERPAVSGFEEVVIGALAAEPVPFGLRGAENEIGFERVFAGLIIFLPTREEDFPAFGGIGGEDESAGASAMFEGVLGGFGAPFGGGGSGAARIAFFGLSGVLVLVLILVLIRTGVHTWLVRSGFGEHLAINFFRRLGGLRSGVAV